MKMASFLRVVFLVSILRRTFGGCSHGKFIQNETGKAVAPQFRPKFMTIADSQIQCFLKQKFKDCECWLLEVKTLSTNKYSCRFYLKDDVYSFIEDGSAIIYEQHKNPCQFNQKPGDACYKIPKDCQEIQQRGLEINGVYDIEIDGQTKSVYCDLTENQGGWTAIQRRVSGDTNFNRNWIEYKNGFGDPATNYWIGLDSIHVLTKGRADVLLRVTAESFDGQKAFAVYKGFSIGSESEKFKLTSGDYIDGLQGKSWTEFTGMFFSTRDKDSDKKSDGNCAISREGGGWYKSCTWLNMNGRYGADATKIGDAYMHWTNFKQHESLKSISLSIKRS
ncbi:microfibril-associated glycoprotein 4-like [Clytia hemisphaerica]